MVLIKIGAPKESNIVTRNKFIANKLIPICIKSIEDSNNFLLLFMAHQDYDDSYMFFQILLNDNDNILIHHPLYIKNISENEKSLEIYKEFISKLDYKTNLYATDLILTQDDEHKNYYKSIGIKAIDSTHASIVDIYFNRDNYIRIKLFLSRLNNTKFFFGAESIFMNSKYNNIEFVKIEQIKYDATSQYNNINMSHYTLWCGPSKYKINIVSPINIGLILSNPLDSNLYTSFYNNDFLVTEIIIDDDTTILLYEQYSEIDNSFKGLKALYLSKELVNKTNIIDPDNVIYEKRI
jgi:hypothetical protein